MADYILYDLAGANREVRFGPFCWLAKFGLFHKAIAFDTVALGFLPKSDYPDPDYGKLPMLKVGEELLKGSDVIIAWLDEQIAENPIVDGPSGKKRADDVQAWLGNAFFPSMGPLLFHRVAEAVDPADRAYFITTREARFGTSLKALAAQPGQREKAQAAMDGLADLLGSQAFLSGAAPGLADYIAISPILWQRSLTTEAFYTLKPELVAWQDRMLDLYDGMGRKAPCAGC